MKTYKLHEIIELKKAGRKFTFDRGVIPMHSDCLNPESRWSTDQILADWTVQFDPEVLEFESENKSPNLPPHLQKKMEQEIASLGMTHDKNNNPEVFSPCTYEKAYQQAYSDLIQELGPVVEALNDLTQPLTNTSITVGQYDSYVCEKAEQAIKHLKERIMP